MGKVRHYNGILILSLLMAIFFISKMTVSRHLGCCQTEIAPFDPPTPKILYYNQTWSGSDAPLCEIFAFKLYCDLERGFRVTESGTNR